MPELDGRMGAVPSRSALQDPLPHPQAGRTVFCTHFLTVIGRVTVVARRLTVIATITVARLTSTVVASDYGVTLANLL
eukprot:6161421-Prymnesium_polylepis.1